MKETISNSLKIYGKKHAGVKSLSRNHFFFVQISAYHVCFIEF